MPRQHFAILLLTATSLSGEIWLLVCADAGAHILGVWYREPARHSHTSLCLPRGHCNLLPAWQSRQLMQHWIHFCLWRAIWWVSGLSTRPLLLSGCAGHIPQTPSWCRASPPGEHFQQTWFIYRLTKMYALGLNINVITLTVINQLLLRIAALPQLSTSLIFSPHILLSFLSTNSLMSSSLWCYCFVSGVILVFC